MQEERETERKREREGKNGISCFIQQQFKYDVLIEKFRV